MFLDFTMNSICSKYFTVFIISTLQEESKTNPKYDFESCKLKAEEEVAKVSGKHSFHFSSLHQFNNQHDQMVPWRGFLASISLQS